MAYSWVYLNIGVIAALVALGAVAINTANEQAVDSNVRVIHAQDPLTLQPARLLAVFGTELNDISAAQDIVGYRFGSPSYLPFGNSLKTIKVDAETGGAIMVFSPADVTSCTTLEDGIFPDKGFIVSYSITEPSFNAEEVIQNAITQSGGAGKIVTINGMRGMAIDQAVEIDALGTELHMPAGVTFFKERFWIGLVADFPMVELIKIAKSIPLEDLRDMRPEEARNLNARQEFTDIIVVDFSLEPEMPEQDYLILKKGETRVVTLNLIAPSEAALDLTLSVVGSDATYTRLPNGLSATLDKCEISLSPQEGNEQFAVREKFYLTLTADPKMKEGVYELVLQSESSDGRASGKYLRVEVV